MNTRTKLLEGIEAFQQGDLAMAARCCEWVLKRERQNSDAHHFLGLAHLQKGEYRQAQECIQRAIRFFERNPDYHFNLGSVYQHQGMAAAAERCMRRAIELRPKQALYRFGLGTLYLSQNRNEEALRELEAAARLSGEAPEYQVNYATALARCGDSERAEWLLRGVVEKRPENREAVLNLAYLLSEQERHGEGAEWFGRAMELNGLQADLVLNRATCLEKAGKGDEALALLERTAGELNDAEVWKELGNQLARKDRRQEAEEAHRRAL